MGHLNLSVFCKQTPTTYTAVTIMKIHVHGIKCITTFSAVNAVYSSQTGLPLFVTLKFRLQSNNCFRDLPEHHPCSIMRFYHYRINKLWAFLCMITSSKEIQTTSKQWQIHAENATDASKITNSSVLKLPVIIVAGNSRKFNLIYAAGNLPVSM